MCALTFGCGSNGRHEGLTETSHGRVNVFLAVDGTVLLRVLFERASDCPPKKSSGSCAIEDVIPPLECAAGSGLPVAGTIVASTGDASVPVSPDDVGLYSDTSLPGFGAGQSVHLHADGDAVPGFDADIAIPEAAVTVAAPSDHAVVSRSNPLNTAWTKTAGSAPLSDVRLIGKDARGASLSVLCEFLSEPPEAAIPAAMLDGFEDTARSVLTLKPGVSKVLRLEGWKIEVLAEGAFPPPVPINFAP